MEWSGRRKGGWCLWRRTIAWAAGVARPAMVVACGWCVCPGAWSRAGHDRRKGRACLWCRDTWGSRPGSSVGCAGGGVRCRVRWGGCRWARWALGAAGVLQVDQGSSGNARAVVWWCSGGGRKTGQGAARLHVGLDTSACAPGCLRPAKGAGLLVGVLYRWRLQRPGISATCVRCVPSVAGQAGAVHGGLDLLLSAVDLGRAVVPRYSGGRRTPSSGSALAYLFVHPERVRLVVLVRLSPGDAFGPSFLFGLFFLVFLGCGAETEVDGRRVGGGPDVPVGRAGRQAAAARHTGYRGRGQVRRRWCAGGGA